MNKKMIACALGLIVAASVAGCGQEEQTAQVVQNTTQEQQAVAANATVASSTAANVLQNTTQTETQTQVTTQAGNVTSKGYKIEEIDGITYVDGVLIVNKTYSLPAGYGPGKILDEVQAAFNQMQQAAAREGLNIYISSGFRSYNTQNALYNRYVSQDGQAKADTYSARPGHSEHQSGWCFDLNTIDDSFSLTPESAWLEKHAQEYGFIIRYPKGKEAITGYQYESWHLRYLGVDLATKIYQSGLTMEEYYGITSQYAD